MRFIFYTDLHLRGSNPIRRTDDFPNSLLIKLKEIYQIAEENKVDCLVFGGDFFDAHVIHSQNIIRKAIRIIRNSNLKTYQIIGQHDLTGYQILSLEESSLGFFNEFCDQFITIKDFQEFEDTRIYSCHAHEDLNQKLKLPLNKDKINILIAHKLIYDKKSNFETVFINDIRSGFDIILSGDLHCGFETVKSHDTIYSNPGSIARLAISDVNRIPSVLLVNTKTKDIQKIQLKNIQKAEEVFEVTFLETIKEKPEMDTNKFIEGILDLEMEAVDIFDLIRKSGEKAGISKKVLDYIETKKVVI